MAYAGISCGIAVRPRPEQSITVPRHTQESGHAISTLHVPAFSVLWCSAPK